MSFASFASFFAPLREKPLFFIKRVLHLGGVFKHRGDGLVDFLKGLVGGGETALDFFEFAVVNRGGVALVLLGIFHHLVEDFVERRVEQAVCFFRDGAHASFGVRGPIFQQAETFAGGAFGLQVGGEGNFAAED